MGTNKAIFIYDPVSDRAWVIARFTSGSEPGYAESIWEFAEQSKTTYKEECSIYVDKFRK